MNRLRALADDRRFLWCLLLSAVLTPVALGLLGWSWEPRSAKTAPQEHYIKIAVLPKTRWPTAVKHAARKPVTKVRPKRMIMKRPVIKEPHSALRETTRIQAKLEAPSPRHNPVPARHQAVPGGAFSATPVLAASPMPTAATVPTPAAQMRVLTTQHSEIVVPSVPLASIDTPTMVSGPAQDNSGGNGTASGNSVGSGAGTSKGSGQGTGNGTGGGPFGIGSAGKGTGEGSRRIVYVLDLSGSMTSRIDRARQELYESLASLGDDESFDIVTFSDEVQTFDSKLVSVTPATIKSADDFLDHVKVNGGTNLDGALTAALSMQGVNVVFVITDGVPTVDKNGNGIDDIEGYMRWLPRHIRALNINHARIYTIGLVGKDPDGHDESFEAAGLLKQIASDSGGVSKIVQVGVASP